MPARSHPRVGRWYVKQPVVWMGVTDSAAMPPYEMRASAERHAGGYEAEPQISMAGFDRRPNAQEPSTTAEPSDVEGKNVVSIGERVVMTKDYALAARQELTKLGYLEDSGERRPDRSGRMQPVYRISSVGRIALEYVDQGFSYEEAMVRARASLN